MRLIIVSNRIPVIVEKDEENINFKASAGGLVQGLSASIETLQSLTGSKNYLWAGWPGATVKEEQRDKVREKLANELNAIPVFLEETEMEKFYLGFCNSSLWPLFHSLPTFATYEKENFEEYIAVNEKFRDTLLPIIQKDDAIWIHDYHLMLLPELLRERFPDTPIGFFLHIPFPPFEIFRLMPKQWRLKLIEGLMGADLIGFHTYGYMLNFLRTLERCEGIKNKFGHVIWNGRDVKIDAFPIGIDFDKYNSAPQKPEIKENLDKLLKSIGEKKVILSIDRLDYSKGILNRLKAFELFLDKNPNWHNKVMLITIIVPSRIGVYEYQKTKENIDMLIGAINGKFGTIDWTPILYQFKNLPFEELTALYSAGDVLLVTPIVDGMNLVSKEYIATNENGVLILSEGAGSYEELRNTITINPNDVEEIAFSIKKALELTDKEKKNINAPLQAYLKKYSINWWVGEFVNNLINKNKRLSNIPEPLTKAKLIESYSKANKRLIILDYDGTLAGLKTNPKEAKPTGELIKIINKLSSSDRNKVAVISGRGKGTLDKWFHESKIDLFAEHGIYHKRGKTWELLSKLDTSWKREVFRILEMYADRLPGSFVEEKDYSLVLSYRSADQNLSSSVISEVYDILTNIISNTDLEVVFIDKGIEIKSTKVNKSVPTLRMLKENFDFILTAGDDSIDEDMFKVLPENAYSIKVGFAETFAKYYVKDSNEMVSLLNELSQIEKPNIVEKPNIFSFIKELFRKS
jgi:trehalose 6-phosphate synthase/phosphatase